MNRLDLFVLFMWMVEPLITLGSIGLMYLLGRGVCQLFGG